MSTWVILATIGVVVALLIATTSALPRKVVGRSLDAGSLDPAQRLSAENDIRRLIFEAGTVLVAFIALVYTYGELQTTREELAVNRDTQRAERFVAAVEQLGSEDHVVQIAGIYGMKAVADSDASFGPVLDDTLAAFVRLQAPCRPPDPCAPRTPGADPHVQVAIRVLGEQTRAGRRIDLSNSNLSTMSFVGGNFAGAVLADSNLTSADITRADLSGANLQLTRQDNLIGRDSSISNGTTIWR